MFKEYFGIRWEFDHDEVDRIIEGHIRDRKPGYVVSMDMNNFSLAQQNESHLELVNGAIVNNCDSSWLPSIVNRIHGTHYTFYCGDDVFLNFIRKGRYRQFFLGSNRRVLDGLRTEMSKLDPKVADMRFEELPFRKVEEFDYEGIARMVNEDAPDIIWVSLGCPKQEQFMQRLLPFLNKGVMFGFGAIFNFYCGLDNVEKGVPRWVVKMKLHFLVRLLRDWKKQWPRVKNILKVLPGAIREEKKRAKATHIC